jgi:hypothetical protein
MQDEIIASMGVVQGRRVTLSRHEVNGSAETAAVAAFAYLAADGSPRLRPVTPLLLDGDPVFTLTYADFRVAAEISHSNACCLVFHDSRLAYIGWTPLAVSVTVDVIPDPEGELFREELLPDELRKFPPARDLVGNLLLQRENWWYLPRHIARLRPDGDPYPVARRAGPDHGVLATYAEGGFSAATVCVGEPEGERIPCEVVAPGEAPADGAPAALLLHDFAVPDMDPDSTFLAVGRFDGDHLRADYRSGSREPGKRPGFIARWRELKDLERRCKEGLRK